MTILEIVLMIELVLLMTIAIVLMAALLQRDREDRYSYRYGHPYAGETFRRKTWIGKQPGQIYSFPYGNKGRNAFSGRETACGGTSGPAFWQQASLYDVPRQQVQPGKAGRKQSTSFKASRQQSPQDAAFWQTERKTVIPAGTADDSYIHEPEAKRSEKVHSRGARWCVDFMEMSSGRRVSRDFRDHLVVGRTVNATMDSGRLYLSMDATVSRSQFCLYVTEDGIMLENLSNVNITRRNGQPVWRPVRLEEGDILQLGRMRYMVKGIRPAA